ncbi:MAG: hypothetical protein PUJ62_03685 [Lachnospiraceae bacterium]|nr:hypothetical protein [Lachnospiraceae bacterium]
MTQNDRQNPNSSSTSDRKDWTSDPGLSGIDIAKLQMLRSMAENARGKTQSELLPFLMAASGASRKKGMQFSSAEMELIVNALKAGKTREETAKIDQMIQIIRRIQK